mgnify:CR=1 FL=1
MTQPETQRFTLSLPTELPLNPTYPLNHLLI